MPYYIRDPQGTLILTTTRLMGFIGGSIGLIGTMGYIVGFVVAKIIAPFCGTVRLQGGLKGGFRVRTAGERLNPRRVLLEMIIRSYKNLNGSFPKIRDTLFGVLTIRILVCRVLY